MYKLLIFLGLVLVVSVSGEEKCIGAACHASQGLQFIGKFVRHYLESQPSDLTLTDGVHLVNVGGNDAGEERAADDNSILTSVVNFLRRHELKIKLPELMPDSDSLSRSFKEAMDDLNSNEIGGIILNYVILLCIQHPFYFSIEYLN